MPNFLILLIHTLLGFSIVARGRVQDFATAREESYNSMRWRWAWLPLRTSDLKTDYVLSVVGL